MADFTEQTVKKWVEEATKRTAAEVSRKYRQRALAGFLALFLGLLVGGYVDRNHANEAREAIVVSSRAVAVASCNRDFRTQKRLRTIISRSNSTLGQLHKEGTISRRQLDRYLENNRAALKDIPLPDCRVARDAVTDNPNDTQRVPPPLFPKKG